MIAVAAGLCCVLGLIVANRSPLVYISSAIDRIAGEQGSPVRSHAWLVHSAGVAGFGRILHHSEFAGAQIRGVAGRWASLADGGVAPGCSAAWRLVACAPRLGGDPGAGAGCPGRRLPASCLDPLRAPWRHSFIPPEFLFYSVALVAYPSFLMPSASASTRARRAGYLYAVAGWVGSALGIGMARNLHRVPPAFVALAVVLFLGPLLWDAIASGRLSNSVQIQALAVLGVLAVAFAATLMLRPTIRPFASVPADTAVERGRRVYIAEGCINCHSQYVRPNTADVAMWGPATRLDDLRRQHPPLIGNRRQGPDLSQVGARRSPLWLRMHFMRPRDVSFNSPMPPYDYLFRNTRGDDLIAYLSSLNDAGLSDAVHWKDAGQWQPGPDAWRAAAGLDAAKLFASIARPATRLGAPPGRSGPGASTGCRPIWRAMRCSMSPRGPPGRKCVRRSRGSPGSASRDTDMPGHEYLADDQVAAIADYVVGQRESRQGLAQK